ncbi:hypothetical protein J2Z33_003213 [Rubellimicrobium aerolatum]|nr:hypothetical protein [Rubellimicrobium aerolatum]
MPTPAPSMDCGRPLPARGCGEHLGLDGIGSEASFRTRARGGSLAGVAEAGVGGAAAPRAGQRRPGARRIVHLLPPSAPARGAAASTRATSWRSGSASFRTRARRSGACSDGPADQRVPSPQRPRPAAPSRESAPPCPHVPPAPIASAGRASARHATSRPGRRRAPSPSPRPPPASAASTGRRTAAVSPPSMTGGPSIPKAAPSQPPWPGGVSIRPVALLADHGGRFGWDGSPRDGQRMGRAAARATRMACRTSVTLGQGGGPRIRPFPPGLGQAAGRQGRKGGHGSRRTSLTLLMNRAPTRRMRRRQERLQPALRSTGQGPSQRHRW